MWLRLIDAAITLLIRADCPNLTPILRTCDFEGLTRRSASKNDPRVEALRCCATLRSSDLRRALRRRRKRGLDCAPIRSERPVSIDGPRHGRQFTETWLGSATIRLFSCQTKTQVRHGAAEPLRYGNVKQLKLLVEEG